MSDPLDVVPELRAKRLYEEEMGRTVLPWSVAPDKVKRRYRERAEAEQALTTCCEAAIRGVS